MKNHLIAAQNTEYILKQGRNLRIVPPLAVADRRKAAIGNYQSARRHKGTRLFKGLEADRLHRRKDEHPVSLPAHTHFAVHDFGADHGLVIDEIEVARTVKQILAKSEGAFLRLRDISLDVMQRPITGMRHLAADLRRFRHDIQRGDWIHDGHVAPMRPLGQKPRQAGTVRIERLAMLPVRLAEMKIRRRPFPPPAAGTVIEPMQVNHRRPIREILVQGRHDLAGCRPPPAGVEGLVPHPGPAIEMRDGTVDLKPLESAGSLKLGVIGTGGRIPAHGAEVIAIKLPPLGDLSPPAVVMTKQRSARLMPTINRLEITRLDSADNYV